VSGSARAGLWVAALAGLGAGLAGGLFGVGGGIVMVPVLTAFFGLTQHQAHGTSLSAVAATALAGIVIYGLAGRVAWLPAAMMAASGAFTARLGARLANKTGRQQLSLAFALFILAVAIRILWRTPVPNGPGAVAGGPFSGPVGIAAALAVGAAVGLLAGFMGVGGGILAVPALTLLFGMPQQTAQGTSLALILGSAPFGAWEHARLGNVEKRLLPGLMLGALIGASLASYAAQRLPQAALARGFAIFLVANALRMMWAASRKIAARA